MDEYTTVVWRRGCLALLVGVALSCAGPARFPSGMEDIVEGPGAVFASVEEAVLDALAWCFTQDRRDLRRRARVRGGTIRPAEGGYTYSGIATASRHEPQRVYFALQPEAVASFRHFPATGNHSIDNANEYHSQVDRRVVDEVDPLHRHSYLLTPRLAVRVYAGGGREWQMANLAQWAAAKRSARVPVITIDDDLEDRGAKTGGR